ncbi:Regulatory protein BlaR1 [Planctomycetes bacterium CA13]|uniref:Regulatory protein BlaR1 n=1 Tax=Novipirellula herctigrandis TaxID=2527986 RepID=A0A5C5ZA18_9BACT|nr:Regulatory protein BlaR1 [Planctomycetes bacterium CA13]
MFHFNDVIYIQIAYALLHFLWLACIPCAILAIALRMISSNALELRYRLSIVALGSMMFMMMAAVYWSILPPANETPRLDRSEFIDFRTPIVSTETDQIVAAPTTVTPKVTSLVPTSKAATRQSSLQQNTTKVGHLWFSPTIAWAKLLTLSYMVGVIVFAIRLMRGWYFGRRLRRQGTSVAGHDVHALSVRLTKQLRLRATPTVLWCQRAIVPTVTGVLRPVVLLPIAYANGVSIVQLEHILLHEFTHLRRYDLLVNFLQNVIETLLFYHPLMWWVSRQVRLYRELSCDAAVVASGVEPTQYAGTLVDIAARSRLVNRGSNVTSNSKHAAIMSVASVSSKSQLRVRLMRLLGRPLQPSPKASRMIDGLSLLVVITIVSALTLSTYRMSLASPQQAVEKQKIPQEVLRHQPRDIEPTELAGIVVDADGKPLSGVTVDAWSWQEGDETTTDEKGVFRFRPDSDNGRSKVEVRWMKPGYSPHYVAKQPVGGKGLVIQMDSSTYIEGTVTAVDGSPAAGVTIRGAQQNIRGDGVTISEVVTETETDHSGNYRLYAAPDRYEITIASSVGVVRTDKIQLHRGYGIQKNIQLQNGVRFEAIVKDANTGEPFEGLVLSNFLQRGFEGNSDAQGRITIDGMLPGEFEFSVGAGEPIDYHGNKIYLNGPLGRWWSPEANKEWQRLEKTAGKFQRNFDDLQFDLHPEMKPVEIFVEQGVEFSGHVYDPDGKPCAGATVAPAKTGSGNSLTGDTRYSIKTGDDGSYKVVMPAGNDFQYNLMAFDGEYSKWRKWGAVARKPLETKPGQKVSDYDFVLTRGSTVRGKVTTSDAAGSPPREVRAHPADLRGNRYYDPTVEVQPDGSFELGGLRPGKHFVQVSPFWLSAEDANNGASVTVEVSDGEVREGIELIGVAPASGSLSMTPSVAPKVIKPDSIPSSTSVIGAAVGGVVFTAQDKVFSTPCFDKTSIFFGACDGNFYCLDKISGKLKWKVGDLQRVDASPIHHDERVYFPNIGDWLHCVETQTGKVVWKKQIPGCGYSNPLFHNGQIVIAGTNQLVTLSPKDGRIIQSYAFAGGAGGMRFGIAAKGNKLVVLVTKDYLANDYTGTGSLVCFNLSETKPAWTLPLGGASFGEVIVDESRCYFGTRDGMFSAVDFGTGQVAWKLNCADFFSDRQHVWADGIPVDNGDSVIFSCFHLSLNEPGVMFCVEKASGKVRWSLGNPFLFSRSSGLSDDSLVTVTLDHKLVRIDRASGNVQYIGMLPVANPRSQGEFYAVALDNGFVFVVDAEKQVWRFDLSQLK